MGWHYYKLNTSINRRLPLLEAHYGGPAVTQWPEDQVRIKFKNPPIPNNGFKVYAYDVNGKPIADDAWNDGRTFFSYGPPNWGETPSWATPTMGNTTAVRILSEYRGEFGAAGPGPQWTGCGTPDHYVYAVYGPDLVGVYQDSWVFKSPVPIKYIKGFPSLNVRNIPGYDVINYALAIQYRYSPVGLRDPWTLFTPIRGPDKGLPVSCSWDTNPLRLFFVGALMPTSYSSVFYRGLIELDYNPNPYGIDCLRPIYRPQVVGDIIVPEGMVDPTQVVKPDGSIDMGLVTDSGGNVKPEAIIPGPTIVPDPSIPPGPITPITTVPTDPTGPGVVDPPIKPPVTLRPDLVKPPTYIPSPPKEQPGTLYGYVVAGLWVTIGIADVPSGIDLSGYKPPNDDNIFEFPTGDPWVSNPAIEWSGLTQDTLKNVKLFDKDGVELPPILAGPAPEMTYDEWAQAWRDAVTNPGPWGIEAPKLELGAPMGLATYYNDATYTAFFTAATRTPGAFATVLASGDLSKYSRRAYYMTGFPAALKRLDGDPALAVFLPLVAELTYTQQGGFEYGGFFRPPPRIAPNFTNPRNGKKYTVGWRVTNDFFNQKDPKYVDYLARQLDNGVSPVIFKGKTYLDWGSDEFDLKIPRPIYVPEKAEDVLSPGGGVIEVPVHGNPAVASGQVSVRDYTAFGTASALSTLTLDTMAGFGSATRYERTPTAVALGVQPIASASALGRGRASADQLLRPAFAGSKARGRSGVLANAGWETTASATATSKMRATASVTLPNLQPIAAAQGSAQADSTTTSVAQAFGSVTLEGQRPVTGSAVSLVLGNAEATSGFTATMVSATLDTPEAEADAWGRAHAGAALRSRLYQAYAEYYLPEIEASDGLRSLVLNCNTTGLTTYTNMRFNSMIQTPDGKVYAAGPQGIYELSGDTDQGAGIDAHIELGFTDFGSTARKRLDNVYIGYAAHTPLDAVLTSEGEAVTYSVTGQPEEYPTTCRVKPAMGHSGRYWKLRLKNTDGSRFQINSIEVSIAMSKRNV